MVCHIPQLHLFQTWSVDCFIFDMHCSYPAMGETKDISIDMFNVRLLYIPSSSYLSLPASCQILKCILELAVRLVLWS